MGKGKDTFTKQKNSYDLYSYNYEGTKTMLKEWTKIRNEQYYSTNYDLLDLFMDFEYALRDKNITSDERLIIAAKYGLELNFAQIRKLTGMKLLEMKKLEDSAICKIVDVLEVGFDLDNLYDWKFIGNVSTVEEYLGYASEGNYNLFDVRDEVYNDLLYKLADFGEIESKTILGQYEREAEMEWENQLEDKVYMDKHIEIQYEKRNVSYEYLDFATFQQTKYYSKKSAATQEYSDERMTKEW